MSANVGPKIAAKCERTPRSVLLVEDEEIVRIFTRTVLEMFGCKVIETHDGESALTVLLCQEPLDLMIVDLSLPGMGGAEVASHARASRPELGVIFVSGYLPDADRITLIDRSLFLQKPYSPAQLRAALEDHTLIG